MSFPSESDFTSTTENEQLLKAMGFSDETEIRQALAVSYNDINEAVAILTNEKLPKITSLNNNTSLNNDNDIDMTDVDSSKEKADQSSIVDNDNPLIFPYDCLLNLENNVFTDNWSIPYKKDEWLGKILVSAIAIVREDLAESDPNCKRFFENVMPEVYRKVRYGLV